jgi:uncharacterized protein (TIGR00269 family)
MPGRKIISCDFCATPPVYLDRAKGVHRCLEHLERSLRDRIREAIGPDWGEGERIGIALSGGKDSTVLVSLLHEELSGSELLALTVDEGIAGYREHSLRAAQEMTGRLGIPHHVITFQQVAGATLDQLVKGRECHACTICGVFRRKALQILARDLGVTTLATGHCLNDEVQTVLMNCLRGDVPHLLRIPRGDERFISRIKPLRRISEKEITVYAMMKGIYPHLPECPYACHALRSEVRSMLDRLELATPGTMDRVLSFQEDLKVRFQGVLPEISPVPCDRCGEPSVSGRCRACTLLETINSSTRW